MIIEEITDDDKKRIESCDYYKMTKEIMKSHEEYKDLNIGEVYFIKYKRYSNDDKFSYVSRSWNGPPNKYIIFHKDDDGFVFLKRINANGKLGKEVSCLTTQYPGPKYTLEPDPEYVDCILFENEEGYDPLKNEKSLNKKKGQARRKNKALEVNFTSATSAFEFVEKLKVGSFIYDAGTTYGQGIMKWEVTGIERRPVDKALTKDYWGSKTQVGLTQADRNAIKHNMAEIIIVEMSYKGDKPSSRRWVPASRTITFNDFYSADGKIYGHRYYSKQPYTVDEV